MALTECANHHIYDSSLYPSCPYCCKDRLTIDFTNKGAMDIGRTVPAAGIVRSVGCGKESSGNVKIPAQKGNAVANDAKAAFSHIVGWLICTEGEDKGRDYRLYAGGTVISPGIGESLRVGRASSISTGEYTKIVYDASSNSYFLIPGMNKTCIYINDAVVLQSTELSAYDVIDLAVAKLVFVPLCCDRFQWKDEITEEEVQEFFLDEIERT